MSKPDSHSDSPKDEQPTVGTSLLLGVQNMEPQQWSRLVHAFGPIAYAWCRRSGLSDADAADVVQEVFLRVARGIGGFQREKVSGSFRSWFATITRNCVRDFYRNASKQIAGDGGTEAHDRIQQIPDVDLESSIVAQAVEQPLVKQELELVRAEFEPKTWQAFWLTTVEDRSPAEVAETTGLALASVYQAKSRVLRRLRARLADWPQ